MTAPPSLPPSDPATREYQAAPVGSDLPPSPRLGAPGEPCAACGAPLADDQRYCLNCGQRRGDARVEYEQLLGPQVQQRPGGAGPVDEGVAGSVDAGAARPISDARAITPLHAAAGLGLLLLAVLVGSVIGGRDDAPQAAAPVVVGAAPTTAPTTAPASFTSDWTGEDGWTVELQVLAKDGTTPEQIAAAKAAATSQGAADVGALDSDTYPTLDPGGYVVYSGVFTSKADAKDALKGLKASFPDARVVEVSTTAPSDTADEADAGGDGGADKALEDLENASPDEFVEKSRNLPDEVGTEGEAPAVDNKAPDSGGNESETIG